VSEGPRFFVGPEAVQAERVVLDADDSHHLLRVLRAQPGEPFLAVAGAAGGGTEPGAAGGAGPVAYRCVLAGAEGGRAVGRVLAAEPAGGEPPVALTLYQGLTRGDKLDFIVQKATEVGTVAVVPVRCRRSVVQLDAQRAAERCERWQRIAREAAQQCRRGAVPPVGPVLDWAQAARAARTYDAALVLWEEATGGLGLRAALAAHPAARRIAVYIGPEGGLTPDEVAAATGAGAVTTHLGPRILRTETAGLAALAAILYERGDLGGRP